MIKRIKNNSEDIVLLSTFIKNSGNSLEKSRYFNSRDLSVIADHIYTDDVPFNGKKMVV